jgi:hypothetical protein
VTPEQWKRAKELFVEALKLSPSDREAYLRNACRTDEVLLKEVESLLAEEPQVGSFLDRPSDTKLITAHFQGTDRFSTQKFLGSGAFGNVYEAYDRERHMLVALKALKNVWRSPIHIDQNVAGVLVLCVGPM